MSTATPSTVTTTNGPVVGEQLAGCRRFLGIPYAAPPFGANRLRRPVAHEPWTEPRPATEFGPTVPKAPYTEPYDSLLPEPHIDGEECLNLNIWTPTDGDGHPVLVWIHGGAFANGSGIVAQYDGSAFARDGVVLVTLNYRLNADGFLDIDDADTETNLGLRDQIAALQWVRDNIAAFGGDPAQVTIAGESAGSMSVAALLSSPHAAGLMQRAIMQSGSGHTAITRAEAQYVTADLARRLGVEPTREALAAVPLDELYAAQSEIFVEIQTLPDPARWGAVAAHMMPFMPVIDCDVLPQVPIAGIADGAAAGIDVLVGSNTHENRLFMVPNGVADTITDEVLPFFVGAYGLPVEESLVVYGELGSTPGEVAEAVATDWMFRIPSVRVAEAQIANGARAFVYEFAWESPMFDGRLGAAHYLEIPFVFDTLHVPGSEPTHGTQPPQQLADEMHRAWVSFVRTGDPGWQPYDTERRPVMRFADESAVVNDPRAAARRLWTGVR